MQIGIWGISGQECKQKGERVKVKGAVSHPFISICQKKTNNNKKKPIRGNPKTIPNDPKRSRKNGEKDKMIIRPYIVSTGSQRVCVHICIFDCEQRRRYHPNSHPFLTSLPPPLRETGKLFASLLMPSFDRSIIDQLIINSSWLINKVACDHQQSELITRRGRQV